MTSHNLPGVPPELSLRSLARMIWKQKIYVLAVWLLVTVAATGIISRMPAVYQAEATLLVDPQKVSSRFVASTVNLDGMDRVAALSKQVLSNARLQKVIEALDLYSKERQARSAEQLVETMRNDIKITTDRGSSERRAIALRVAYRGSNPKGVADVANQLASLFIDEDLRSRETQVEGTSEFLENQLAEAKGRLDEQEAKLSRYKLQHSGELPEQQNSLVSTLAQFHARLQGNQDAAARAQQNKTMLENAIAVAESSQAALRRMVEQGPSTVTAADVATMEAVRPSKRSEQLEAQLDQLRLRYSDDHPEAKRLIAEIALVKRLEARDAAELARLEARMRNTGERPAAAAGIPKAALAVNQELAQAVVRERDRLADLKAQLGVANREIEARRTEREGLLRDIAAYQARIDRVPIREQEMAALMRDYEISKTYYRSLLDKKLDAEMAADMERRQKAEKFTLIDRAQAPGKRVSLNPLMLKAVGFLLGLAMGVFVGVGRELKKNCLIGEWELPAGTVILGRVPEMELAAASGPSGGRKWRAVLVSSVVLSLLAVIAAYFGWKRF